MPCKRQIVAFLSVLFVVRLNMLGVECFGISSFGKANTDPPKAATTTVSPARQCSRQAECAGITGSSCVRTHYDPTTRCLCGENQPPVNGQCDAQHKALYHVCANSDECNDGLVCGTPNITGAAPAHLRVHAPTDKICLCDAENGFVEKEHTCSDADIVKTSLFAIFVVSCIRKVLAY
ncbi:oogenesis-related protein sosie isoform X2 [Anticarsia gemmatalis]|uniref:oogenesis-related protein sosie isoform X2 n=1 Tax=Anticarsia gemmatalis TaxID=129554 RepID=UPI003F76270E